MIALALALTAVQAAPVLAADDEIVVTAQRARKFRYRIGFTGKPRTLTCKTLKSSGDKALDVSLCEAARSCIPAGIDPNSQPSEPQLTTIRACLNKTERAAIEARAAELRAARAKS